MTRVAIFEDEAVLQYMWEDILNHLGFEIAGISAGGGESSDLAETLDFDLAIIDANLEGELSDDIVQVIEKRGIPMLICTGQDPETLPECFARHDLLMKPFAVSMAERQIRRLVNLDQLVG